MKATGQLWEALVVEVLSAPDVLRAVVPAGGSALRMRVTVAVPGSASGTCDMSVWVICGPLTTTVEAARTAMYGAGFRIDGGS
jgi:hypothetical protein